MDALDVLRLIVLLEGGIALGLAWFVIRLYLHANRVAHMMDRPVPGALPYHVFMIAGSHALLISGLMVMLATQPHGRGLWAAPVALAAYTLSIIGLVDMLRYQRLRIYRLLELAKSETKGA